MILADILVAARPMLAVAVTDCKAACVNDLILEQSASMKAFLRLNKHVLFCESWSRTCYTDMRGADAAPLMLGVWVRVTLSLRKFSAAVRDSCGTQLNNRSCKL